MTAKPAARTPGPLDEPCFVCMVGATHSDGRKGDAYIGNSLQFDTLDPNAAKAFPRWQADEYADHWRGWYRGFAGGCVIEVRTASEYEHNPGGAWCPLEARAALAAAEQHNKDGLTTKGE